MSVHIFDIDYTFIRKNSAYYFLLEALRTKLIPFHKIMLLPFEMLRYKLRMARTDFIEHAVKQLAGLKKVDLEQLAQTTFEQRIKKNIYPEAERLVRSLLAQGEQVYFATSSLETIIEPLEKYMGVHGAISSRLAFADGVMTGKIDGVAAFGKGKLAAVAYWMRLNRVNSHDVYFYSDSYTDVPLLLYVGHPIAVNPDPFLARIAKKNGWKVLRFE